MRRGTIHGVGINDADYQVTTRKGRTILWTCPFYQKWVSMMMRSYSETYKAKNPAYYGTTVCEEWHRFSTFRAWMVTQDWEGNELDKDILSPGNKEYHPDRCVFVTRSVNVFLTDSRARRGEYPIGVHWDKSSGYFLARIHDLGKGRKYLGRSDCPHEAHKMWLAEKLKLAKELAKEQNDPRVAEALIERYTNYEGRT